MAELLTKQRRSRKPSVVESPPSASNPKELFVATHRMASSPFLTANLSRAVIQSVWQSEPPSPSPDVDDFGKVVESVLRQIDKSVHGTEEAVDTRLRRVRHQLTRRVLKALLDANQKGRVEEINASLESWLASFTKPPSEDFLDRSRRLDERGQTDAALDIIFDQIDEMLLEGEFARVDHFLRAASVADLSVDILLGVLTATLPAKTRLANRPAFFAKVEQTLRYRGQCQDGLLVGLQ